MHLQLVNLNLEPEAINLVEFGTWNSNQANAPSTHHPLMLRAWGPSHASTNTSIPLRTNIISLIHIVMLKSSIVIKIGPNRPVRTKNRWTGHLTGLGFYLNQISIWPSQTRSNLVRTGYEPVNLVWIAPIWTGFGVEIFWAQKLLLVGFKPCPLIMQSALHHH